MGVLSEAFADVAVQILPRAAAEQAGVISGDNPAAYNPGNPFRLWVIQLIIIMGMTQLLSVFLARMKQPRVIAEVIGGIILGPTVMGRIPNFTNSIFPKDSLPFLSLVSTIGLVLFLFLVGLEVDTSIVRKNARASFWISAAGILLPFGVGAGIAVPIYHKFVPNPDEVSFGYFLLFVGVAISITAFPVLCRILTELRLLDTDVGVIVLSAGVGNDVVGWILLALVVALVNAGSGLTALWVLLTCVGFIIFLTVPVRWAFHWVCRWDGSLENGEPSTLTMTLTLVLVLASAFFTDIIGVHAIFGGFLAGLIIPKENGFAIAIVEKVEDLVTIVFLPLYFALSGLKTNLGLLDNGITWAYVIIIAVLAFFGKFIGCAAAARVMGFNNRESGAIGCLMSCKGLVELIVLNIGLQANILDTRLFSIFVLDAIILTFITTPLTIWVYPARVRKHLHSTSQHNLVDAEALGKERPTVVDGIKSRFTIVLHKMEYVPVLMNLVQYLQPPVSVSAPPTSAISSTKEDEVVLPQPVNADGTPKVSVEALRLIELTQRTSDVMRGTTTEDLVQRDPVLGVFRTFGTLNKIPVASALHIVPYDEFSGVVATHATNSDSDLVIVPWIFGSGHAPNEDTTTHVQGNTITHNPFEGLFGKSHGHDKAAAVVYSHFIRSVFAQSPSDVALFVDHGLHNSDGHSIHGQHVFLPFFGGPDDRLALSFVVQLCMHPGVNATVLRITKTDVVPVTTNESDVKAEGNTGLTVMSTSGFPDTVYPGESTQTRAQSDHLDSIAWNNYFGSASGASPAVKNALTRVSAAEIDSATPLADLLKRIGTETIIARDARKSLLVVAGRGRRLAAESHAVELRELLAEQHAQAVGGEVRKSLGEVACAVVVSNVKAGLLVVQASPKSGN